MLLGVNAGLFLDDTPIGLKGAARSESIVPKPCRIPRVDDEPARPLWNYSRPGVDERRLFHHLVHLRLIGAVDVPLLNYRNSSMPWWSCGSHP